ncbi:cyclopropane-fatty-acyl-phospholipid synthase family protein [Modestobacter marinus]|uniref:Cyclopropane-fatty-acyl-phospholipid synthase n=1 Tax=Modestobacter marinus TaxID=477641 RepID=A0A846LL65_9ACTN|nr:cyclopropane-fatty-acyl-phospholipid synthase family protein [Modestobacter marinus]NIH66058.1 cyclopropane-fatty-acyl-phospholipid synthase [Modestobacter marinus]GGL84477.1 cyclopropane-fatty-acyl-phospholipid synthase [Modestobacter marinus]
MTRQRTVADRLAAALGAVLGTTEPPVRLRGWDGSLAGPPGAPVLAIRSRRALRRLVWSPGQLGLARAYVAGDIDIEGDVFATFAALRSAGRLGETGPMAPPTWRERLGLLGTAVALGAIGPEPAPPAEEVDLGRAGRRHSRSRDAAAISHHYDVGNDFYALVLGPSMVYSCAVWETPETGLDAAQEAKLDLVCRKLGLTPGSRLLDVGCGWGSMAIHAAQRYGADVVGITLSEEQARMARKRVAEAGLTDRVDIRVQDYRAVDDGPFDAISSIGMAEHVGRGQMPEYVAALRALLRPGGRLLNHAINWNAGTTTPDPDTFISRYVFPDGELLGLGETVGLLESADLEVLDVEALRQHYALTLRAWVQLLEQNWSAAVAASSEGRARVWRLYMAACALAFEGGDMGVNQVLLQKTGGEQPPLRRTAWT